ncbi:MAG: HAMP domain-containing protein [Desulfobacterales bacterium]|nr:HAMP domain-containing protein [Desulfobacterales bacterium]
MKLSVQKRISIAFITLVLLGGLIWAISDYRNNLLSLKFHIITEKNRLLNTILEARRYEKNYFLYFNEKDITEAIDYSTSARKQLADIIDKYQEHARHKNLSRYYAELKRYQNSLVQMHKRYGEKGKAELVSETENREATRELGRKITSDLEDMVEKERLSVDRLVKESRLYIFLGTLCVFILAMFVAFYLIFKVNRPLKKINQAVRKIADGDYEKIPPLQTGDEFDEFVNSLNTMIIELGKRNEQLVQSRKMASLGTLTSGVAHELNNPLNNISTSLQIAIEEIEGGDPAYNRELLTDAETQVERARDIVKALLEFSRERDFKPKQVAIESLIDQTIKLIKGELPSSVNLSINVPGDLYAVMDFRRIQQVLINLILNAVHAMDGRGELTIRAEQVTETNEICLQVQDTGKGIPKAHLDKIFDPFYSTKEVGTGTGLGLSVSHGIVENHGGRIHVESREGEGTTFYVYLPIYGSDTHSTASE